MSTNGIYQGLQGEKSSSRVSQPPGGGSSNIFGTDLAPGPAVASRGMAPPSSDIFGPATPTRQPSKAREDTTNNIFGAPEEENVPPSGAKQTVEEDVSAKQVDVGPSAAQSAQAYAKRMQQGLNPITGEKLGGPSVSSHGAGEPKPPPIGAGNPITGAGGEDQPAPVMRVRQPPGGTCNKLW